MINNIESLAGLPHQWEAPIIDRHLTQAIIVRDIETVVNALHKKIRLPGLIDTYPISIFYAAGEQKGYAEIIDEESRNTYKIKAGDFQNILFEVMKKYGFNENKKIINEAESVDGREKIDFPSQTISGLIFRRTRDFNEEKPEETYSVEWEVLDAGPKVRLMLPWAKVQEDRPYVTPKS